MLGIAQFVYSAILAIENYPHAYSITNEFLSDLGRFTTEQREDNGRSAKLFNRGVILLGCSLIPFFLVMPTVLQRSRVAIRTYGVLSAAGLIGIGLTPYDRFFVAHNIALLMWLGPMLVMVATFFMSAQREGFASRSLRAATVGLILAACAYAMVDHHRGHVIFQKLVAIAAAAWFCLVFGLVSVSTIDSVSRRRLIIEEQALRYIEVLKQNPRRR